MILDKITLKIKNIVDNSYFQNFILSVIVFNAIILGLETSKELSQATRDVLAHLDHLCLGIFVIEIILKLIALRFKFFKEAWNLFDFAIVAISLMPNSGALSVLRVFRIFRALKIVSSIPRLKLIVNAILQTLPSMGWVAVLIGIIFYIFAVIGTGLFAKDFPEFFGTLGESIYTLFQVMTLESWSAGVSRPVMEVFPYAYLYFVPFILFTSFIMLNVVIGIVCNTITNIENAESERRAELKAKEKSTKEDYITELKQLRTKLDDIIKNLAE